MTQTKIVIFFVGLTMFSSQIPNDLGWKAVLPRVVYVDPRTNFTTHTDHRMHAIQFDPAPAPTPAPDTRRTRPAPAPAPTPAPDTRRTRPAPAPAPGSAATRTAAPERFAAFGPQRHVEDHQAVLIFPNVAWHPSSSWPRKALQTDSTHSYVELDADHVRFLTQPPAGAAPFDQSGLILPPLTQLCSKMNALRNDFLPPYQGAAAVFDLAQNGELSSCLSTSKANMQRLDSKLVLTTTSRYFVASASTMKTNKELRLDLAKVTGSVNVYVGNIPKRFLAGDYTPVASTQLDGVPHVQAYYGMGVNGSTCAQPLKAWYDAYVLDQNNPKIPQCGFSFSGAGKNIVPDPMANPGEIPPGKIGAFATAALTFECSNTQWP